MSQSPQPLRRRRNVAKLLARLNPKGIGLPTGGGRGTAGSVESAIEIAAALGYISRGSAARRFAALVLCLRWWPGAFEGPAKVVGYRDVTRTTTRTRLGQEHKSTFIERVSIERPTETPDMRTVVSLLASRLRLRLERASAAAQARPKTGMRSRSRMETPLPEAVAERALDPSFLLAWARAVIYEYRNPNQCPACLGYGEQMKLEDTKAGKPKVSFCACEHCGGQGVMAWSVKRRAKALRIGEHTFRQWLNPHHSGALALLRELEWRGAAMLVARLGTPDGAA